MSGDANLQLGAATEATVTIADDDVDNEVTITATTDASEPATDGQFTVNLTEAASTLTTVTYTVGGTATADADYTALTGTVDIAQGETSATIDVAVVDDLELEGDESVVVTLTAVSGDANLQLGAETQATVTIADDDVDNTPVAIIDFYDDVVEDTPRVLDVLGNDSGNDLTITSVIQPANGSVDISNGTITYTPDPDFFGNDTFTYAINNGVSSAAVNIIVNPVNDPPQATDDSATTTEDTPITVDLLANDSDVDSFFAINAITEEPESGSVRLNSDGTVTYTPSMDFEGTDSFTYTITDGQAESTPATVWITVEASNDPPRANIDFAPTNEDTEALINVVGNDVDPDDDPLTVTGVSDAAHGSVAINDNLVSYTPDANFFGNDSFSYTVSDGNGGTALGLVNVTVAPVNDPPVANDDFAATEQDTPVNIPVLTNDSDLEGGFGLFSVTLGTYGSVAINPDGTLTYTPDAGVTNETDTFTYTITDGQQQDTAVVTVGIGLVNNAPNATDDTANTREDVPLVINVRGNDTDPDGQSLTVTAVGDPADGTVVINDDQTVTYTPDANFNGPDSFTYTISDGELTDTATVSLSVDPVNDPPEAVDDTATTSESTSVVIGVLDNDSDEESDVSLSSLTQAGNGSVTSNPDGTLTYTPNEGFFGIDTFTYTITDGALTDSAQVTITVEGVVDVLNFNDFSIDSYGGANDETGEPAIEDEGRTLRLVQNSWKKITGDFTITPTTILQFDFFSNSQGEIHGIGFDNDTGQQENRTFRLYGTQNWGYDDFADYASFAGQVRQYRIPVGEFYTGTFDHLFFANDDDSGKNAVSSFSNILIFDPAAGTPPVAQDDEFTVVEDSDVTTFAVLDNDDPGTAPVTITSVTPGSEGGTITTDGQTIEYQPALDFDQTETFTYTIESAVGQSTATVTVNVTPVADPPLARPDNFTVFADSQANPLDALANDSGESIFINDVTFGSEGGSIRIVGQQLLYTPAAGFSGTETFSYTISDGTDSDTAEVTVTVRPDLGNLIDFGLATLESYSDQDVTKDSFEVLDAGATLSLSGNTWKSLALDYEVTADTILEFTFQSDSEGEIHGIGFDNDNAHGQAKTLNLYGTQGNWGNASWLSDPANRYTPSDQRTYQIRVGDYYNAPEQLNRLFFVNDNDDSNAPVANSVFRNVQLYEQSATQSVSAVQTFSDTSVLNFSQQTLAMASEIDAGPGADPIIASALSWARYRGGLADDTFFGSVQKDEYFVGRGRDRVAEFTPGEDLLMIQSTGETLDFDQLRSLISEDRQDTVFDLGKNNNLRLLDRLFAELDEQDFPLRSF